MSAYSDLFARAKKGQDSRNAGVALPKISEAVKQLKNRKIATTEVEDTINYLALRKSPGVDWLGSLFYKSFTTQLNPVLKHVFADALERGLMPP